MIRGLDNWIMGVNDPNAPFNQTDWVEQFSMVIDECDWITDEMLEDLETYNKLEKIITEVVKEFIDPDQYWTSKQKYKILMESRIEISTKFKEAYEDTRFFKRI